MSQIKKQNKSIYNFLTLKLSELKLYPWKNKYTKIENISDDHALKLKTEKFSAASE